MNSLCSISGHGFRGKTKIILPPTAITSVAAPTVTDTGIIFTWSGGLAQDGTTVTTTYTLNGSGATPSSSGTGTATFTGLNTATVYTFVVTATNIAGSNTGTMIVSTSPYILTGSNNGSSLGGWFNYRYPALTGNFTVTTIGGQTCFKANGDLSNYIYINTVFSSLLGRTFSFNVYLGGGCPDVVFGCNSSGAGNVFRFETRNNSSSGFCSSTGWLFYDSFVSSYTWTKNTWLAISIPITSGGVATVYVNGVSSGLTTTILDNGGYIGFNTDGGTGYVGINSITVT